MNHKTLLWLLVATGTMLIGACRRSESQEDLDSVPTPKPEPKAESRTNVLTRADYGDSWPFNVPSVTVGCGERLGSSGSIYPVYVEANGVRYALNGVARSYAAKLGWSDVAFISPDGLEGIVIDAALQTCW